MKTGNVSKHLTKQLLLSSNYWVLNKTIVQIFGLETAFLLSTFAEAEQMMANEEGWFYQTSDTVQKITTLSRHKQDQCINKLEEANIIEKKLRDTPPKRYFRINYDSLTNQIVKNPQIELSKINKSNCEKSATNKESSYKESSYKESIINEDDTLPTNKEIGKAFTLYEQNGFGLLNGTNREVILDLIEEYNASWVVEAMEESIDNNVRKMSYVRAILLDWHTKGKSNKEYKRAENKNKWKVDAT